MGVKRKGVLELVSGWAAIELLFQCVYIGLWQLLHLAARRLWKGHRRKLSNNNPPVELTVDSSIGIHCYIKIMGVKYHYVETGPRTGQVILILGDAPDTGNLWVPSWSSVVRRLAENGYHVITLDLRGSGGSESGDRRDLSPPRAVEELAGLLKAVGVSEGCPAIVIGFGIGGLLTW
ncbi:epoxide hydrolase 3-like [Zerene cesonia]|uniref:epoxide hydrolase 3-like n=1 Tax=Zerene cesonia TaxID=33412 RepID=UPI0018E4FB80|nr:epoxide hydrolase 3-like [Zerene cesonia]